MEKFKDKEIIIASGPVIIEDNEVLLNKHGDDPFWKFLGGKVEDWDFEDPLMSLEEACKREAKEENGIDIEILNSIKPMMIPHPSKPDTWVILIHYLAKRTSEINLADEIDDFRKFDVNELIEGKFAGEEFAPNIIPVLKEYIKLKGE